MTGMAVSVAAGWTPPERVPDIGQVLALSSVDVRYRDAPLRLRVMRVRLDISGWYDGRWVWLEGHELDDEGFPINWQQLLVSVAAIGDQAIRAGNAAQKTSGDVESDKGRTASL